MTSKAKHQEIAQEEVDALVARLDEGGAEEEAVDTSADEHGFIAQQQAICFGIVNKDPL